MADNNYLRGLLSFGNDPPPAPQPYLTSRGLLGGVLPWAYSTGNQLQKKLAGLLNDPMGQVEQTAGILNDNANRQNALMAAAFADPTNPTQITNRNALAEAANNMLTGPLGFAPVGMAALVKPLGNDPHFPVPSLDEYTSKLYRDTSIDRAADFLPNSAGQPQNLWFSNEPAYALGQGSNRGVMMEFDARGIPGQLSLQKPMARQQYKAGNAEFIAKDVDAARLGQNLQSVRISPEQQRGPYFRRVQGLLNGWNATKEPDGTLVFSRQ